MFQRGVKPTRNFIHCPYGNGGFSLFSIILPEIGRKKKKKQHCSWGAGEEAALFQRSS